MLLREVSFIAELQDFEWLGDVVFYTELLSPAVVAKTFFFFQQRMSLALLGKLEFYIFTFVYYKLFQINKF